MWTHTDQYYWPGHWSVLGQATQPVSRIHCSTPCLSLPVGIMKAFLMWCVGLDLGTRPLYRVGALNGLLGVCTCTGTVLLLSHCPLNTIAPTLIRTSCTLPSDVRDSSRPRLVSSELASAELAPCHTKLCSEQRRCKRIGKATNLTESRQAPQRAIQSPAASNVDANTSERRLA